MTIQPSKGLRGRITVPGDKSISHRAVMLGALAEGTTVVDGFLMGADCLSTISCFREMGISIDVEQNGRVTVHGRGLSGLRAPSRTLDAGNSGTTARLLSGILAAQPFGSTLDGDESLRSRPMGRVLTPLSLMGAKAEATEGRCPIRFSPASLTGIRYALPVASAQLKSALLLAGLFADGVTAITEPAPSRDHTERMLRLFGADVTSLPDGSVSVSRPEKLAARPVRVPGDISSAAFFLVAALILPDSELLIENVGVNPTRTGLLDALWDMGANIELLNLREDDEPVADLLVRTSKLHGVAVGGALIPRMIDELPVLAVAAAFAEGETVIRDAQELRVKESNRIDAVAQELQKAGVDIRPTEDGLVVTGGRPVTGAVFDSRGDHRIAMSCAVLALAADSPSKIQNAGAVDISFPGFFDSLTSLTRR